MTDDRMRSLMTILAYGSKNQFPMLHTFGRDQSIGDLFDLFRPSAQEQYLQTKMRCQMKVHG